MADVPIGVITRLQRMIGPVAPEHSDYGLNLAHQAWLLEEMRAGRLTGDKAQRALGWVQCFLCAQGITTLAEERAANAIFYSLG